MIVLGLNYSAQHDAAAAIAQDEHILFAVAEERVSRIKHDGGFPKLAIEASLHHTGISLSEIDQIVCGWPALHQVFMNDIKNYVLRKMPGSATDVARGLAKGTIGATFSSMQRLIERYFGKTKATYRSLAHHHAHALSAYVASGFERSVILVMDGRGAWEATSIWLGEGATLRCLRTIPWPNSLGLFYATLTGYLGFEKYRDEWKVMGLAPYGKPGISLAPLISYGNGTYKVRTDLLLSRRDNREYGAIEELLGSRRRPDEELTQRHKDIAWAVQNVCEEVECEILQHAVAETGCRSVCIAGGVGLNSKANGVFLQRRILDDIFVQPAAGDDGVALGAALLPAFELCKRPPELTSCYFGPSYQDHEIRRALDTYKLRYKAVVDPSREAAELLAQAKLVGWFQGREEFGPRALGNRSILADPRHEENRDKVNMAVKFRESWRPFAPSVLADACPGLFENFYNSPFMILTFPAKPEARDKIAAAIHVDGSARVQSVTKEQNPRYYALISEFERLTGVPAVLNTSFNLKGEAIVSTPFDAIRTFFTSGLDALVIGGFVLRKAE